MGEVGTGWVSKMEVNSTLGLMLEGLEGLGGAEKSGVDWGIVGCGGILEELRGAMGVGVAG